MNNIANASFVGPPPTRPDENGIDALLRLMFDVDPGMRPTVRQVATHPYLHGYSTTESVDEVSPIYCLLKKKLS